MSSSEFRHYTRDEFLAEFYPDPAGKAAIAAGMEPPPNCAPLAAYVEASAGAWRSSPTSATSGSPSPNPARRQPDPHETA